MVGEKAQKLVLANYKAIKEFYSSLPPVRLGAYSDNALRLKVTWPRETNNITTYFHLVFYVVVKNTTNVQVRLANCKNKFLAYRSLHSHV